LGGAAGLRRGGIATVDGALPHDLIDVELVVVGE